VTKIDELGTTQLQLATEVCCEEITSSSETSVLTRKTLRNNPEDTILNSTCISLKATTPKSMRILTNKFRVVYLFVGHQIPVVMAE
jgi:hypothetical protein